MIYIGNSNTFKGILNKEISDTDLTKLYENLVKSDVVNFSINSVGDGFYPVAVRAQILTAIQHFKRDSKIVILNDKSLHLYKDLTARGFSNILLVYGKWKAVKKGQSTKVVVDPSTTSRDIMRLVAKSNFKEFQQDTSNIISLQEFMNMSDKFDLIIANPPFSIGNKVITKCLDKADQLVVLMPVSDFKAGKLFQHVINYESIDTRGFTDAKISSTIISLIQLNFKSSLSWDSFVEETYSAEFKEFYSLNNKHPYYFESYSVNSRIDWAETLDPKKTFLITARTVLDGTHIKDTAYDLRWNKYHTLRISDICPDASYPNLIDVGFLVFKSEQEQHNLCRFWYDNVHNLMEELLFGLHKKAGSCYRALPHIDWSVDRDYEHLTYEDLLKIMKEETKHE